MSTITASASLASATDILSTWRVDRTPSRATRVASPRHFRIGDIPVSVQSVYAPAMRDFAALYSDFELSESPADAIRIEVIRSENRRVMRRRFEVWGDGEKRAEIWTTRSVLPHIESAINWQIMLYWPRLFQIHAGVVQRNGGGVIFPASPGSGKSTLTTGLVARGWRYLSDEFALIDPESLELRPYPKSICLKHGSFGVLKELGLHRRDRRVYYRSKKGRVVFISPREFGPAAVGEACPLNHIIFVRYQPNTSPSIRRITRADAVLRMTRESFNFMKFRSTGIDLLAKVVRQADCFELTAGGINETCDLVSHVVDGGEP